ncbi:MAG: hypothetical protein IJU36_00960 [Paludibacteraceae bacterium]|nr:hypothetical protein [Paludibacteraceae bacterium]
MKTARYFLMAILLVVSNFIARADETITVSSTGSDISENLDLRAVATLFGEVSNLEEFEQQLNSEERHISNLDLNGDGIVDYLRVVEMESNGTHLIIIQAVLAKDIYQDVASISVEKDEADQVHVQIVGDAWLYGENYIIEPVYIYRPVIYDWFWATTWVCWASPWYWGYWPAYWGHGWVPWTYQRYCYHVYDYHRASPRCTYHYPRTARSNGASMRSTASSRGVSRRDLAAGAPERSFSSRNTGMTNARQIASQRSAATVGSSRSAGTSRSADLRASQHSTAQTARTTGTPAQRTNTYGSTYSRSAVAGTSSRSTTATTTSRSSATTGRTYSPASSATSRSTTATTTSRSSATTGRTYSPASSVTSRSTTSSTYTPSRSSSSSISTRSSSSTSTRSSSSTSTRSTSTYTPSRSSGSYGGGSVRSSGSYGGGGSVRSGGGGGGSSRGGGGTVRR